jgi:hypothetical protein
MSMQQNVQINERLWQAWVVKNRELDRRGAAKRVWFLSFVLALTVVGAAARSYF